MDHARGGEDQGWRVLSFGVIAEANDLSFIARGRDQGERGAQEEDERRGRNGRQLDRRPAGHGEGVPGVRGPAQREFGKAQGQSELRSEGA